MLLLLLLLLGAAACMDSRRGNSVRDSELPMRCVQDQIEGLLLLCRHNGMAALARRVEALLCGLPDEEQGLAVDCQWQPLQAVANDPMG